MNYSTYTHKEPSPLFILSVIESRHPDILQEAKDLFIPLKYDFELIHKIKETTTSFFSYNSKHSFSTRDIILGTIVLLYSRVTLDKTKNACLHSGVAAYASGVLGMFPANISKNFDKVHLWLRIEDSFYEHCDYIRCMVTGSGN